MSLYRFAQWLEQTRWSVDLHQSILVYPVIESIHVLCLCLFLGMTMVLDLRLLGAAFRGTPLPELTERLRPWTWSGFAIMAITGCLLFYGVPVRTYGNVFFRLKLLLLILAGINAWWFHAGRSKARMAGAFSIAIWTLVVIAGRMIAYDFFDQ
jgi:hypothetical protein